MRKLILGGLVAVSMGMPGGAVMAADMSMMSMPGGSDVAAACMERTSLSEGTCACVAMKAAGQLDEGQTALLLSFGDGEPNYFKTARDNHVSLGKRMEVRWFLRFEVPACMANH